MTFTQAWLLLSAIALVLICILLRKKQQCLPPGPRGLPLIGHLHLLSKGAPHHVLQSLARDYGPIMFLRFGAIPIVVASSNDSAREFLKVQDATFASRPPSATGRLLTYNHSDLVFAPYGERWRQLRRLSTLELFTVRRLESFAKVRFGEVQALVSSILSSSKSGSTIDVRQELTKLTFNTITQMLMSKSYFGDDVDNIAEAAQFVRLIDDMFEICGEFPIGDYLPYLRWLDLDGVGRRFKKISRDTDKLLEGIISEHESNKWLKEAESGASMDFLDVLLSLRDNGQDVLQGDTIKALMINLLAAGTDTSSVTIEWALAELINHPVLMFKAEDEINKLVGRNRLVQERDILNLPYLQAVVKETFRLHPPVPLLVPHQSMEACKVMGYEVPGKTTLLVNVYAIGRDSHVWEDAKEFIPERFEGSQIDVRGHDFELLPFGAGRRACPGITLALSTVHVTLANLIHGFDWKIPQGQVVDTASEKYGLTVLIAKKLEAIPRARLASEAYTGSPTCS